MKSLQISVLALILIGCSQLFAVSPTAVKTAIMDKKYYSWSDGGKNVTRVGFSLHNKSGKTAFVLVDNESLVKEGGVGGWLQKKLGGGFLYKVPASGAQSFLDLELDTAKQTTVKIYNCTGEIDKCNTNWANIIYKATFDKNKTIYVNWNGKGLYPQKGPLKGITGATDKGYALEDDASGRATNVARGNIKKKEVGVFD